VTTSFPDVSSIAAITSPSSHCSVLSRFSFVSTHFKSLVVDDHQGRGGAVGGGSRGPSDRAREDARAVSEQHVLRLPLFFGFERPHGIRLGVSLVLAFFLLAPGTAAAPYLRLAVVVPYCVVVVELTWATPSDVDGGLEISLSKRCSILGDARYTPIERTARATFLGA
jgi:hypothetical protein